MFDVIKLSRINIKYFIENKPKTADNIVETNNHICMNQLRKNELYGKISANNDSF